MRRLRVALVGVLSLVAANAAARAQGGVMIQGILDVEGWVTDTTTNLLRKNNGKPAEVLRLQMWSAVEPWRGIFIFAQGGFERVSGNSYGNPGSRAELEQGGFRLARDPRFVVDAGKMFHPVGAFAPRIFSTRNPLIGIPDGYSPVYPVGVMVSGEVGRVDYRAGVVSRPLTHRDYVPTPKASLRPALGFGITPLTGLRFGASATDGSYLNDELTTSQLNGRDWRSYHQRILAGDVQYGIGHFDFRGEYAHGDFDVPYSGRIDGHTAYVEGRYTVAARVFVAVRGEVNNYPFITPSGPTTWVARRTEFKDVEAGVGVRVTASTLLKASYRADDWVVTPANAAFIRPGGRAVAVQVSQAFDVMDWVGRFR